MEILTNYLTNEYIQKGYLLQASDWILTSYRALFNGSDVEIWIDSEIVRTETVLDLTLTRPKKLGYALVAIVISPLALIAAFFKLFLSPSLNLEIIKRSWLVAQNTPAYEKIQQIPEEERSTDHYYQRVKNILLSNNFDNANSVSVQGVFEVQQTALGLTTGDLLIRLNLA